MSLNPYIIFKKIKKIGIKESFKTANYMFQYNYWSKAWIIMKPVFYISLFNLMFNFKRRRKRLMGVWDWAALPWSVGDPMMFIEDLNILKERDNFNIVDICVILDGKHPEKSIRKTNLTAENSQSYAMDYLPIFTMCSGLGTVHLFNDRRDFYHFIENNINDYEFYPSLPDHLGQKFNSCGGASFDKVVSFYKEHNYYPPLKVSQREEAWAMDFFKKHVDADKIPVVISLKNTVHSTERNADLDLWYDFLKRCHKEKPEVQFIQVGLKGEADPRILDLKNVIFSKDYGTTLIQDISLVGCTIMYMGACSGICSIPLFSALPYVITNLLLVEYERMGIEPGDNLPYATNQQKIFPVGAKLTSNLLFETFCDVLSTIDKKTWLDKYSNTNKTALEHPSTNINKKGDQ